MDLFLFELSTRLDLLMFKVVVLGCGGGPKEKNLSSYLIAPEKAQTFLAVDAGTLLDGIECAYAQGSFSDIQIREGVLSSEVEILRTHITAYLLSHAHLDHIAGLCLSSYADEGEKSIFGTDQTIDSLRKHIFNWQSWPNLGSEGRAPCLGHYQYRRLKEGQRSSLFPTDFFVEPFLLNHSKECPSTAFLIESSGAFLLYVGDTAPDALEKVKRLYIVWERVAPLIREGLLRAIFLECSHPDELPENALLGHLDPKYMLEELTKLAQLVDFAHFRQALKEVKIVVTHIKDNLRKGPSSRQIIQEELERLNSLSLSFLFPTQGQKLEL